MQHLSQYVTYFLVYANLILQVAPGSLANGMTIMVYCGHFALTAKLTMSILIGLTGIGLF